MIIVVLYPILLGITYKFILLDFWEYLGFPDLENIILIRNILVLEFNFLFIYLVTKYTRKVLLSDVLITLFLASAGSSFIIIAQENQINKSIQVSFAILLAFFISRAFPYSLKTLQTINTFLPKERNFYKFLLLGLFIVFGIVFTGSDFQLDYFSFAQNTSGNIFSKDGIASRSNVNQLGALYGYLLTLFRYVIAPWLIIYSLGKKNLILYLITFSFLLIIAIMGSYKADLIIPFLVTFIWVLNIRKNNLRLSISDSLKPHGLFLLFSNLIYFYGSINWFKLKMVFSNLIMRAYFVQGQIMWHHNDFFEKNQPIFLTHNSFLKYFYPYDEVLPRLIGEIYGGGRTNSNWISVEGFASFGSDYGVIIGAILVGVVFSFFNNHLGKYFLTKESLGLIYPLSIAFCDIPFTTTLLSGGLVMFIIFSSKFPESFGLKKITQENR